MPAMLCVRSCCAPPLSVPRCPLRRHRLKIGIVGTGNIGGALATHWAKAGHELVISSRHPEELKDLAKSLGPKVRVGTPSEAAKFGDVILLSVPYKATPQVGRDLANDLEGQDPARHGQSLSVPRRRDGRGRAQARHRRDLEGIPAGRAAGARVQCNQ